MGIQLERLSYAASGAPQRFLRSAGLSVAIARRETTMCLRAGSNDVACSSILTASRFGFASLEWARLLR